MTAPVKLPKEVLDLFPQWEYRCPCCGSYFEDAVAFCDRCKTVFDETKWRVPPRFLKSSEAMSEYAHKVLAPTLTSEQRKLLFVYFTEFFNDGFESGDFSEWTSTSGSPGVQSSVVHDGSYALSAGTSSHYVTKTFTAQSSVYCRFYVRWTTNPSSGNYFSFANIRGADHTYLQQFAVANDSGTIKWAYYDTTWHVANSPNPTMDTWYCFEVHWEQNTSNGEIWVDGSSTFSGISCKDNDYGKLLVGCIWLTSGTNTFYVDCVVVADTYVGPETSTQSYSKTWPVDVILKKLDVPKNCDLDAALQRQNIPKNFGLDVALQRSLPLQKVVDAVFKKVGVPKSFSLDACFGGLATNVTSRQIDVVFKKLGASKTFGLDAYFGAVESQTYSVSFGLDCVFAYKVRLPELWLDENGKLVFNISKPYAWVGLP